MNHLALAPLVAFRRTVYAALGPRRDALCDLVDALLASGRVPSLAHLSLAGPHRRGYGSLYAALAHGRLDQARLDQARLDQAVRALPLDAPEGRDGRPALMCFD